MKQSTEQQVVALFVQAMRTALALIDEKSKPAKTTAHKHAAVANGIFPHQSKYNPWRAYIWDKATHKTVYLGAFPSVNQAKLAQRAYRKGQPVAKGTKAPALRLVRRAA